MGSRPMDSRPLALAVLAALAALINLHAPTLFFDLQLMLGSGVAVLALLLFGWAPWWTGQTKRTTLLTVGDLLEQLSLLGLAFVLGLHLLAPGEHVAGALKELLLPLAHPGSGTPRGRLRSPGLSCGH